MTEHAAGFDLHAAVAAATTVKRGQIQLIPCGFAMASRPATKPRSDPAAVWPQKRNHHINAPEPSTPTTAAKSRSPLINLGPADFNHPSAAWRIGPK